MVSSYAQAAVYQTQELKVLSESERNANYQRITTVTVVGKENVNYLFRDSHNLSTYMCFNIKAAFLRYYSSLFCSFAQNSEQPAEKLEIFLIRFKSYVIETF